jgi:RNA methyltransferase, TrmH family
VPALAASNHRIRRLRRLSGRRSARAGDGAFVLEGPAPIAEALESGHELEGLYLDETSSAFDHLVDLAEGRAVPVHRVVAGVLDGMTDAVTPRPVLAVAAIPQATLAGILERARSEQRPVVVLAEVRDPGNVGTIVRSADAAGAAGVVCTTGTADPWAPKVVRSSAGSLLHLPVVTDVAPIEVVEAVRAAGIPLMVTDASGGVRYDQAPLGDAVALVLGNEAHGVLLELAGAADQRLTIPMDGAAESLNVAVAASVLLFDALRQRRAHSDWTRPPADDKVNTS